MALISPSRRLRLTPLFAGVEAAGLNAYQDYNHILLATIIFSIEEEYHYSKPAVLLWSGAFHRQS